MIVEDEDGAEFYLNDLRLDRDEDPEPDIEIEPEPMGEDEQPLNAGTALPHRIGRRIDPWQTV